MAHLLRNTDPGTFLSKLQRFSLCPHDPTHLPAPKLPPQGIRVPSLHSDGSEQGPGLPLSLGQEAKQAFSAVFHCTKKALSPTKGGALLIPPSYHPNFKAFMGNQGLGYPKFNLCVLEEHRPDSGRGFFTRM